MKTAPFARIQSSLRRDPDCLFNTGFLVTGDFGFGKTTFLDYLSFHVVQYNIVTIRITCPRLHVTPNGFADAFYSRLRNALVREATTVESAPLSIPETDAEEQVAYLAAVVTSKKRGILIILDDYHKHRTVTAQVFDFLGMLQILKDDFTRQNLNVGFVVAGLPEWEKQLPLNKQLSGFLDSPTVAMPEITPDEIANVFNQRIAAYCVDSHARTIQKEFIERVFAESGPAASYREYLDAIVGELEQDNFAIVDSPIAIGDSELEGIRKIIERDPEIASAIKRLRVESSFKRFTKQQVEKCLELLVQIGLRGGVSENDDLFMQNGFYFQRLNEVALIQKQRTLKTSRNFLWALRKRLNDAVEEVQEKYKRSLSDYFLKLYVGERERVRAVATFESPASLKKLSAVLVRDLPKATLASVQQAKGLYESLLIENPTLQQKRELASRASLTLQSLMKAVFQLDGTNRYFDAARIANVERRLTTHWLADEVITEAYRRFENINANSDRTELEMAVKQGRDACDLLIDVIDEISRDIGDVERPFTFRHRASYHSIETLKIFAEVQKSYFSANPESHFRYVESVTDHLEKALRGFLYVTGTLVFGVPDYEQELPAEDRKYSIQNSKKRERYSIVSNVFDGLTRSQFRTILTGKGKLKSVIADHLELTWAPDDRDQFFNLFAEESIASSHKQLAVYSATDRARYVRYCVLSEQLLASINTFAKTMVSEHCVVVVDDIRKKSFQISDCLFRFGAKPHRRRDLPPSHQLGLDADFPFVDGDLIAEHSPSQSDLDKVRATLNATFASGDFVVEDLYDVEYLRNHYDVPFVELICCLTFLSWCDRTIRVIPWFGSSVLICPASSRRSI